MILLDIIQDAEKAAGLSQQGVLFLVVFACSGAVVYMFHDAKKTAERVAKEHAESFAKIIALFEERTEAMDLERKERIAMLLQIIKEETAAKLTMSEAIHANTQALTELRSYFKETCDNAIKKSLP